MNIYGYSHIHTRHTDGDLSLSEIKNVMLSYGASFVFVADHKEYLSTEKFERLVSECQQLSDDKILIIPGLEVVVGRNHLLVLGVKNYYKEDSAIDLLKKYKADGCLIIWAHPHRSKYKIDNVCLDLLDGIEIWNSAYDTKYCPRYNSLQYIKRGSKNNWLLLPGLDFHRSSHLPGPKIFLSVGRLEVEEVIKKIKSGEYLVGKKTGVKKEDFLGKKYYYYFCLSLFLLAIFNIFKTANSILLALHIKVPARIKNYLRKYI